MLKRRDNFGSDGVALPRRNIFAPPAAAPSREPTGGGIFDPAAACPAEGSSQRAVGADAPVAGRLGARSLRPMPAPRVLAAMIAVALTVVVSGAVGQNSTPQPAPIERPAERTPAPAQTDRPRSTPRPKSATPRRRRPRQADRMRPRPRRPVRRHAVPRALPVAPRVAPAVPPRPTAPRAPAEPAHVPADSPPEFM